MFTPKANSKQKWVKKHKKRENRSPALAPFSTTLFSSSCPFLLLFLSTSSQDFVKWLWTLIFLKTNAYIVSTQLGLALLMS